MENAYDLACHYYDAHYEVVFQLMFQVNEKRELGKRSPRRCRFCGGTPPEATFENDAHAIPEALGNRGLTSAYECDACNKLFGNGIENDLGEWSKPYRTFARIRGKKGVPTLKKNSDGGWRIEMVDRKLEVRSTEDDAPYVVDEANKRVIFTLKRGSYTPVAVFKAFVKIGMTLIPEEELEAFASTLQWIRDLDHGRSSLRQGPIIHTFQNGPMPNDKIVALVLRRRASVTGVPYAFLVLGYGNDVFQVLLPAPEQDESVMGRKITLVPYPSPGGPDPSKYGLARPKPIDMSGRDIVRGEETHVTMGFDGLQRVDLSTLLSSDEGSGQV